MDTSHLNPQVQKLLEETGTSIKDQNDLLALSNVSVRELAKLFDDLAKNLKENQPKKREEVFRVWKDSVVEKYMEKKEAEKKEVRVDATEPTTSASDDLISEPKQLSEDEFNNAKRQFMQSAMALLEVESEIRDLKNRMRTTKDSSNQHLSNQLEQLSRKCADLLLDENSKRDAMYYTTLLKKCLGSDRIPVRSSLPERLTTIDSSLRVDVIKHVFDDELVLQFELRNTSNNVYNNVQVECFESIEGLEGSYKSESVDVPALDCGFTFLKLKRVGEIKSGQINPVLKYTSTGHQSSVRMGVLPVNIIDYLTNSNSELPKHFVSKTIEIDSTVLNEILSYLSDAPHICDANNNGNKIIISKALGQNSVLFEAILNSNTQNYSITTKGASSDCNQVVDALKDIGGIFMERKEKVEDKEEQLSRQNTLSLIPQLQHKGTPLKTSKSTSLSSVEGAQIKVEVVKHTHPDSIVIQFVCTNLIPSTILQNAVVEHNLDQVRGLYADFSLEADLPYNVETSIYSTLARDGFELPSGVISNTLNFEFISNGENEGEGYIYLQTIDLSKMDFVRDNSGIDFDCVWSSLGCEQAETTNLENVDLQGAVSRFVTQSGLNPLESTRVCSGKDNHTLSFAGITVDGDDLLIQARVKRVDNGSLIEVAARSNKHEIMPHLVSEIVNNLNTQIKNVETNAGTVTLKKNLSDQEFSEAAFDRVYAATTPSPDSTKKFSLEAIVSLPDIVNHFVQKSHLCIIKGGEVVQPDTTQHALKMYNTSRSVLVQYQFNVTPEGINVEINIRTTDAESEKHTSELALQYNDLVQPNNSSIRERQAQESFDAVLSKVPKITSMGVPFASSEPTILTDPDDDMHVECTKHIYAQHLILQYDIQNKNDEMEIVQLETEISLDGITGLTSIENLETGPFVEQKGTAFVILKIDNTSELPFGNLPNLLNLQSGGNTYQMKVEDVELTPMDFVVDFPQVNFTSEWNQLSSHGDQDLSTSYPFSSSMHLFVEKLICSSFLAPCGNTGRVFSEDHHTVHFSGKMSTGDLILIKADIIKQEGQVIITFNSRSQHQSARSGVPKGLSNRLNVIIQQYLKMEEDLNNPYFRDIFSKIAPLKRLGAPHSTKDPILLSKPDSDLVVRVIKHTWPENIVLQFECTNMNPAVELENLMVESEIGEELSLQFLVEAGLLLYNEPEYAFVALEKNASTLPVTSVRNVLSFQSVGVDPRTGEQTGQVKQEKVDNLLDVDIQITDYFSGKTTTDFTTAWAELGQDNENSKSYTLPLEIQDAVNLFILQSTIPPIPDCSITVSGSAHELAFIARIHNGAEVLFKANFAAAGNHSTEVTVTARTEYDFLKDVPDFIMHQ